ncbi:hypothetical protein [Mesorhizobium sp.]|uniref:hypothetical protein n=1 Tax=Mesorhizobium sp. TaxID=1871066 RepID=UPI0012153306|nr:hypothetical protein [Mesorhizobium sp.]TIS92751.1 MAG: hypothetical protein E5W89_00015 [Mesorhizobium sp.]
MSANPIDTLIPAPAVRRICGGIGHTTLHRWLNGDTDPRSGKTTLPVSDFPKPARVINTRRYWSRAEVERFAAGRRVDAA